MKPLLPLSLLCALVISGGLTPALAEEDPAPAGELAGLWKAKKSFGPELRGALTLEIGDSGGIAEIAGFSIPVEIHDGEIRFVLPDELGSFIGRIDGTRQSLRGHWVQPPPAQVYMPLASPVHFQQIGPNRWLGQVTPRASEYTFFLVLREREDGSVGEMTSNSSDPSSATRRRCFSWGPTIPTTTGSSSFIGLPAGEPMTSSG